MALKYAPPGRDHNFSQIQWPGPSRNEEKTSGHHDVKRSALTLSCRSIEHYSAGLTETLAPSNLYPESASSALRLYLALGKMRHGIPCRVRAPYYPVRWERQLREAPICQDTSIQRRP